MSRLISGNYRYRKSPSVIVYYFRRTFSSQNFTYIGKLDCIFDKYFSAPLWGFYRDSSLTYIIYEFATGRNALNQAKFCCFLLCAKIAHVTTITYISWANTVVEF